MMILIHVIQSRLYFTVQYNNSRFYNTFSSDTFYLYYVMYTVLNFTIWLELDFTIFLLLTEGIVKSSVDCTWYILANTTRNQNFSSAQVRCGMNPTRTFCGSDQNHSTIPRRPLSQQKSYSYSIEEFREASGGLRHMYADKITKRNWYNK